jgi:PDZ domain
MTTSAFTASNPARKRFRWLVAVLAISLLGPGHVSTGLGPLRNSQTEANRRGWLGLGYEFQEPARGMQHPWLFVRLVTPGGPSERAGLRIQDAVTEIEGRPLPFKSELDALGFFERIRPGDKLSLTILRGPSKLILKIVADEMPRQYQERWKHSVWHAKEKQTEARRGTFPRVSPTPPTRRTHPQGS